jgi:hypothetical protein
MRVKTLVFAVLLACIGCGGATAGAPADGSDAGWAAAGGLLDLGGTFHAFPLNAVDGVAYILPASGPSEPNAGVRSQLAVFVSDRPNLCGAGPVRSGETMFNVNAQSADVKFGPGTFHELSHDGPGQVDVNIIKINATCDGGPDYASQSGTVTITEVTDTEVAGTFEVTLLGDGSGTLEGSFRVPLCEAPLSFACSP